MENMENSNREQLIKEIKKLQKEKAELIKAQNERDEIIKSLTKSADRFRLIAENSKDSISLQKFNMQMTYVYLSPGFKELTGYSPEEYIGKSPMDLIHPDDKIKILTIIKQYISNKWGDILMLEKKRTTVTVEYRMKVKSGDWRYFQAINRVVGKNILSVSRDITEQKQAEKEIKRYTKQLEQQNKDLDAFSHTVAHDLKNPLGTMMGFANIMLEDYDKYSSDEIKEFLHIIEKAGKKSQQIINSLLLLANIRKNKVEISYFDMGTVVNSAVERLYQAINENNATIELPDSWPTVVGYPEWIEEVWMNYLSNAIKYGGAKPEIKIGYDADKFVANDKELIRFWIKDSGQGILPQNQKMLFSKFERLNQVEISGHGLGLSIVNNIINKLGGEVGVESELSKGSLFYFTLPTKK